MHTKTNHRRLGTAYSKFLLAYLALALSPYSQAAEICTDEASLVAQSACLSDVLKKSDTALREQYNKALSEVSSASRWDERKSKIHLERAQKAWRGYVVEHCTYLAGRQTGGNADTSNSILRCLLGETQSRTQTLADSMRKN